MKIEQGIGLRSGHGRSPFQRDLRQRPFGRAGSALPEEKRAAMIPVVHASGGRYRRRGPGHRVRGRDQRCDRLVERPCILTSPCRGPGLRAQQSTRRQLIEGHVESNLRTRWLVRRPQGARQRMGRLDARQPCRPAGPGAPRRAEMLGERHQDHGIAKLHCGRSRPLQGNIDEPGPEFVGRQIKGNRSYRSHSAEGTAEGLLEGTSRRRMCQNHCAFARLSGTTA